MLLLLSHDLVVDGSTTNYLESDFPPFHDYLDLPVCEATGFDPTGSATAATNPMMLFPPHPSSTPLYGSSDGSELESEVKPPPHGPNVNESEQWSSSQITYSVIDLPPPPPHPPSTNPIYCPIPMPPPTMAPQKPIQRSHLVPNDSLAAASPMLSSGSRRPLNQRQKVRHNKVEKKYRQNINTKIANLQSVIPWAAQKVLNFEFDQDRLPLAQQKQNNLVKINKSEVLDIARNYILHLQRQSDEMYQEMMFIRLELAKFTHPPALPPTPMEGP